MFFHFMCLHIFLKKIVMFIRKQKGYFFCCQNEVKTINDKIKIFVSYMLIKASITTIENLISIMENSDSRGCETLYHLEPNQTF